MPETVLNQSFAPRPGSETLRLQTNVYTREETPKRGGPGLHVVGLIHAGENRVVASEQPQKNRLEFSNVDNH
jgi:hypothetical protein